VVGSVLDLRRTCDCVVGGEDRRVGPLGFGDDGVCLLVRRFATDPDRVSGLSVVWAVQHRFQRAVAVGVDHPVEDEGERSVGV
jgi:hypothetical protein